MYIRYCIWYIAKIRKLNLSHPEGLGEKCPGSDVCCDIYFFLLFIWYYDNTVSIVKSRNTMKRTLYLHPIALLLKIFQRFGWAWYWIIALNIFATRSMTSWVKATSVPMATTLETILVTFLCLIIHMMMVIWNECDMHIVDFHYSEYF